MEKTVLQAERTSFSSWDTTVSAKWRSSDTSEVGQECPKEQFHRVRTFKFSEIPLKPESMLQETRKR